MIHLSIRYKPGISLLCLISLASSIQLSQADVSDDNLPGEDKGTKKIFKRLLANYNPFQSPNPNKIFNVTTRCSAYSFYTEELYAVTARVRLAMRWTDKRLTWTPSENKRRYLMTFRNLKRLWTPKMSSSLDNTFKTTVFFVSNNGKAAIRRDAVFNVLCYSPKQNVYPYSKRQCTLYFSHAPDYRIVCGKKYGLECCLNSKDFLARFKPSMWKIQDVKHRYLQFNRYGINLMVFRLTFTLVRQSAENHFYISPPFIVGIMSAFQCLISLSNIRRYLVVFFLILTAFDCVIASMAIRVIRVGGGQHLINLCAFTLVANILYLVWSCMSVNVSRAGGISSSALKLIVEKADRYRFFLLLPSHVEIAESSEKSQSATWNYFSLLMDRVLFVVWIALFAALANSTL